MCQFNFIVKLKTVLLYYWNVIILIIVPIIFLPLAVSQYKAYQCTFVLCLVALFWITEVLNLAVTSLIPIVLFPAFGILTPAEVGSCYMKDITIMLIGSLIVAKTIEKQNLHTRLALRILLCMGPNQIFQLLGFMVSSWFLSMWINNTAAAAMMVTIGTAVIHQWELIYEAENTDKTDNIENGKDTNCDEWKKKKDKELKKIELFSKGLYLSIAYAASCGGFSTLTGTGPNLIFYGFMEERYPSKFELNYGSFMLFALPVSVIILFIAWVLLCFKYVGIKKIFKRNQNSIENLQKINIIKKQYLMLGSMKFGEILTLLVFCFMVLLWILREPGIPLLAKLFTYKNKFGMEVKYWSDSTTAILASLLVFILPSKNPFRKYNQTEPMPRLLDWKTIEKEFSWSIVFLFGCGFALAEGCSKSGLSNIIGEALTLLANLPEYAIIFCVILGVSFLTEFVSNSATSTILLPIMLKMAECSKIHPMKMGLATTIACSFSFCFPGATPPNAIIISTGKVRVMDMVSTGFSLDFICVFILTVAICCYSIPIFQTNDFPIWINENCTGL